MKTDLSTYSWPGVLQFLYTQYQKIAQKQNLWFLQKKDLTDRIKQLQGKLSASQAINIDLKHRNNMLQYCLRQIKIKQGQTQSPPVQPSIPIPQRRPKSNKTQIAKILGSLGVQNLIQTISRDVKTKVGTNFKIQIPENKKKQIQKQPNIYQQIAHLSQHQDGVRDITFLNNQNYMISVSQDSTMKIWDIEKNKQKIQSVTTIREHNGPIFTAIQGQGFLYTGGMQGIIRCWNLPRNLNKNSKIQKGWLVGSWSNSEQQKLQPIWQLLYFPQKKFLMSTSSQVAIRNFQIQNDGEKVKAIYKCSYIYHSNESQEQDIPTALVSFQGGLFAGYVNNSFLVQFDMETQKAINTLKFPADSQISTNKLTSNNSLIAGAFQDAHVRLFDKNKLVHSFEAHKDSVTSVCFTNNSNQLFSCGQDGDVKLWDLRKWASLQVFHAHKSKYDEAAHCLSFTKNRKIVASGGADGVVKVYSCEY